MSSIDQQLYDLPLNITIVDFYDFVHDKEKFVKRVLLRIYSSTPKTKYAAVRSVLAAEDAEHFDLDFEDKR